jgi:hypothetical protein
MPKTLSNGIPRCDMHFACPANRDPHMCRLSPLNPFAALSIAERAGTSSPWPALVPPRRPLLDLELSHPVTLTPPRESPPATAVTPLASSHRSLAWRPTGLASGSGAHDRRLLRTVELASGARVGAEYGPDTNQ